jgi:hypothetical protein
MKQEPVILVCARYQGELFLPDNKLGQCADCGYRVQYRPHAPTPHRLRCVHCTAALFADGDEMTTTVAMLDDLRTYFKKMRQ